MAVGGRAAASKQAQKGRTEIRLGGFGGQGIVTAGYLLGRAAILEGKHAVLTKAFGPEIRGARVTADVVISSEPIDYPKVTQPDLLVCLAQEAYDQLSPSLNAKGKIFIDEDLVRAAEHSNLFRIGAQRLAEQLGSRVVTNNVMLGFLAGVTAVVSREALEQALLETVRPKARELNQRALQAGFEYGKAIVEKFPQKTL